MSKAIIAVFAVLALVALSGDALAQRKKCPKGKVYSETAEKCVTPQRPPRSSTPRGSW